MLFQYILGELGVEALAHAQNSVRTFVTWVGVSQRYNIRCTSMLFANVAEMGELNADLPRPLSARFEGYTIQLITVIETATGKMQMRTRRVD